MPFALASDRHRLHWRLDGRRDAPPLLLLNSLGADTSMWDGLVPLLADRFRLLRFDMRGHGATAASPGDYSLALLAGDAVAVLEAAGVDRASVCGISLGGMVAMRLALDHPARLGCLVVANSSAELPSQPWDDRARLVRQKGTGAIADAVMERFFSARYRAADPPALSTARGVLAACEAGGYAGCCVAIRDMRLLPEIGRIAAPTLVIGGEEDAATPSSPHAEAIVRAIPGARLAMLPAGHLSAVERPDLFAAEVAAFLQASESRLDQARAALLAHGLGPRRAVLGDAWVDRAMANRTAFAGGFQEFITRYAWGEVWGRPGLDHRTRRLLVLATTMALGRWEEFRLHVRAGLERGGFTPAELREVLIQGAVYAGVPAANTAFHHAEEILREVGAGSRPEA